MYNIMFLMQQYYIFRHFNTKKWQITIHSTKYDSTLASE